MLLLSFVETESEMLAGGCSRRSRENRVSVWEDEKFQEMVVVGGHHWWWSCNNVSVFDATDVYS